MSCFNLVNKHPHRCTTDDGAKLYVYVTIYSAIRRMDKSGRATQLNPPLSIAVRHGFVIIQQKRDRSEWLKIAQRGVFSIHFCLISCQQRRPSALVTSQFDNRMKT